MDSWLDCVKVLLLSFVVIQCDDWAWFHNSFMARTNLCYDLAKATKASDGKKKSLSDGLRRWCAGNELWEASKAVAWEGCKRERVRTLRSPSNCPSAANNFFLVGALAYLRLTRRPARNRTTTGSLSATQEWRHTNWATRTTVQVPQTKHKHRKPSKTVVFCGLCFCFVLDSLMDYVKVHTRSLLQPSQSTALHASYNYFPASTNLGNDLAKATKASDRKKSC